MGVFKNLSAAIVLAFLLTVPATSDAANKKKDQPKKTLRVLYWNIQNGMWAGQPDNYQAFVDWINSKEPDICIFDEGATIYYDGTAEHMPNEERYLPAHWDELCARWGHSYHVVTPRRPSTSTPFGLTNYPQVITSRYPIDSITIVKGHKPDTVIVNYSGWYQLHIDGVEKPLNIVTLHLKHGKYGYGVPQEERAASTERYEGEAHRVKELCCILDHTIRTTEDPDNELWIMAGDYNSYSVKDNFKYKWNNASLGFQTQNYMLTHSPYYDIVAECYPNVFLPSLGSTLRIDYFYVTKPLVKACTEVDAQVDMYTKRVNAGVSTFWIPSDHTPIIVDFKISKMK